MNSASSRPRLAPVCSRRPPEAAVFAAKPPLAPRLRFLAALSLACVLLVAAGPVFAQNTELRTVRGQVIDKNNAPLPSAVVYLKDVRSSTVRTYITDQDGNYRFSGVEPNADYELHAETNAMTSSDHAISSFDNRKEIVVALKVDKEKKKN